MRALMATNDPVLLSFVESLLKRGNIAHTVLDQHMSLMEGSVGILPRRVLVAEEDWESAAQILIDTDLGSWIASS